MKNILVYILSLICCNILSGQTYSDFIFFEKSGMTLLPDVMNNVNILDREGNNYKCKIVNLDTFSVFPGYPKTVTGQSFEGGIYCQMDTDNDLEIVYAIGQTLQAWNIDGTNVAGWPKTLSFNSQGAPAFGDIDGDGQGEIVMGTSNAVGNAGAIYAYKRNGTLVTGFPISHGATSRSIVLGDLDNDNVLELITNRRTSPTGQVWVYKGDGSVYQGWPKTMNHVPGSSSAVGDITGDGIPEIVAESFLSLYVFDRNGNVLPGFPFSMPNGDVNSYSSPVLADIDGDNIREIIFGTHNVNSGGGAVYILKNNGAVVPGWPKTTTQWIYGPPVLAHINGDNLIDIIIADQVASGVPADYIYGWDKNGNVLNGFPIGPINGVNNQVLIANIDGDNFYELIVDDNSQDGTGRGQYWAYNHDGTPVSGWPLNTFGTTFFNMPVLADLNANGIVDMAGAGGQFGAGAVTNVYIWNTGALYDPIKLINPVWQFNVRHNGVYGDNNIVGISSYNSEMPDDFILYQNYPNPFNPKTVISYQLAVSKYVTLDVYDVNGKNLVTLVNEYQTAGSYEITFDGSTLSSGVYYYELNSGDIKSTKKMLLIK